MNSTLITAELIELNNRIEEYNKKLHSIHSNSCTELKDEIKKLNEQKQYQLEILNEMKHNELEIVNHRYKQQIIQLNQRKDEKILSFKKYAIKYLEKMKKDLKKTNETKKEIHLMNKIYNEWLTKNENNSNQQTMRYIRTRSTSTYNCKNNKLIFPPPTCLNNEQIQNDLNHLLSQAKEQNIELSPDIFNNNKKYKSYQNKKKTLKYKTGVNVNSNDKNEIENICEKIGINLSNKALSVCLYGYENHLDVYLDIFEWINNYNLSEQTRSINELKSGKLRDLKVKLSSNGTVGRKTEMANGIKIKIQELTNKYKNNQQTK